MAEELTYQDIMRAKTQSDKAEETVDRLLEAEHCLSVARMKMRNLDDDLSEEIEELGELKEKISTRAEEMIWLQDSKEKRWEDLKEIQELREEAMQEIELQEQLEEDLERLQDMVDSSAS